MTDITALMRRPASIVAGICAAATIMAMRPQPTPAVIDRGAAVYREYCVRCHGTDGGGVDGMRSIRDRHLWRGPVDSVIVTLAFGAAARNDAPDAAGRRLAMPPIPYNDADVAAVTTYLFQAFKGRGVTVDANTVRAVKERYRAALRSQLR
jgi:mono/diheme cytochrome c family protein